jgi:tetratricopeptide (TPR) repeat protein
LAYSLATYEWNWTEAEREFKRAIELNLNAANSHYYYGMTYLQRVGRTQEAIAEIKRALELEPLALAVSANTEGSLTVILIRGQALPFEAPYLR